MADFFKVAIIDDERDSANALIAQLKRYPRFHIEGVAENATSGIEMLKKVMPDLLFLDVELPEMYGMELLSELDNEIKDNMRVVFYTAHDKYMINALRNSAFDFLLKPIDRKEFEIVISRFLLDNETKPVVIEKIPVASSSKESSFMVILPTGEMRMVKTAEVGFFRYVSERKIWEAALVSGESVALRRNVSAEFLCSFNKNFVQSLKLQCMDKVVNAFGNLKWYDCCDLITNNELNKSQLFAYYNRRSAFDAFVPVYDEGLLYLSADRADGASARAFRAALAELGVYAEALELRAGSDGAVFFVDVRLVLVAEVLYRADDGQGRGLAEAAERRVRNHVR